MDLFLNGTVNETETSSTGVAEAVPHLWASSSSAGIASSSGASSSTGMAEIVPRVLHEHWAWGHVTSRHLVAYSVAFACELMVIGWLTYRIVKQLQGSRVVVTAGTQTARSCDWKDLRFWLLLGAWGTLVFSISTLFQIWVPHPDDVNNSMLMTEFASLWVFSITISAAARSVYEDIQQGRGSWTVSLHCPPLACFVLTALFMPLLLLVVYGLVSVTHETWHGQTLGLGNLLLSILLGLTSFCIVSRQPRRDDQPRGGLACFLLFCGVLYLFVGIQSIGIMSMDPTSRVCSDIQAMRFNFLPFFVLLFDIVTGGFGHSPDMYKQVDTFGLNDDDGPYEPNPVPVTVLPHPAAATMTDTNANGSSPRQPLFVLDSQSTTEPVVIEEFSAATVTRSSPKGNNKARD